MANEKSYAPIVVTHQAGLRFAAQVRAHTVIVDQPQPTGDDAAPMPIEMLGVSLGTCVALYVQQFLATRGLPFAGLRVEVAAVGLHHPSRVGEFAVRVVLPAGIPAEFGDMLQRVARSCPAHNTLALGAKVHVSVDAGAARRSAVTAA